MGFTNRLKSTKACAFHLYFAQHHFGVFDKISVHRNTVFVCIKVYPVWLYIHHSVTLLQDKNIARNLRACVCLKSVVRQTDSSEQLGSLGNILAYLWTCFIHRTL